MTRYTVFLPAPSFNDLQKDVARTWVVEEHVLDLAGDERPGQMSQHDMDLEHIEHEGVEESHYSPSLNIRRPPGIGRGGSQDSALMFSQDLSELYEGVVFKEDDLEDAYALSQAGDLSKDSDAYEWSRSIGETVSSTQGSLSSVGQSVPHELPPTSSYPVYNATQDTSMDNESSADITRDSSDASIQRLPTFRIPINQLSSLKELMQTKSAKGMSNSRKVALLVGLLDVEGPDYIRLKKGVEAGKEVALLKLVMGDVDGGVCKVTVWRGLAEEWGELLSRGDVVLFQDMLFSGNADGNGSYTALSNVKSTATVCYRTMPLVPEDKRMRPDLRLAAFDPAIAKVAQVARWLQQMRGMNLQA